MHQKPADLLREHGLSVTAQRLAVLQAVAAHPHITADEAISKAHAEIGAISRQAVYDALAVLADKGVIRRIQPMGSPARYETRVGDNQHHLICRSCGKMVDGADGKGYEIDEAEVIYWGRCARCRRSAKSKRGA